MSKFSRTFPCPRPDDGRSAVTTGGMRLSIAIALALPEEAPGASRDLALEIARSIRLDHAEAGASSAKRPRIGRTRTSG
jgi:hypothetical protein